MLGRVAQGWGGWLKAVNDGSKLGLVAQSRSWWLKAETNTWLKAEAGGSKLRLMAQSWGWWLKYCWGWRVKAWHWWLKACCPEMGRLLKLGAGGSERG